MGSGKGYVYILTNPSFREDWVKIGKSSRPVDVRSKELDNTAVPLPFEVYATLYTSKYSKVEKQIHKQIDRLTDLRIRQNREFFNIAPAVALDIMRDTADLLDDAELAIYVDGKPVISQNHMVGINIGDTIIFDELDIPLKVATDDKVEYEGRLYSLSAFTGTFLPVEKQNTSGAYQGPKYFSFKGKVLADLRNEIEQEKFGDNNQTA